MTLVFSFGIMKECKNVGRNLAENHANAGSLAKLKKAVFKYDIKISWVSWYLHRN